MRRLLLISLIFSLLTPALRAGNLKFSYSLEWGLSACTYSYEQNVFLTEEQFPVRTTWSQWMYHTNGYVWAVAGVDIIKKVNISVYTGYQGIGPKSRAYPLALRATYYFRDSRSRGIFASLAGGLLLDEKFALKPGYTANAAAGYRIILGYRLSLDFKLGIQFCRSHPREFTDQYTKTYVTADRVISSVANRGAIFAGISLNL